MGNGNPPGQIAPTERQDECAGPSGTTEATDSVWTSDFANIPIADLDPFSYAQDYTQFGWDDTKATTSYPYEYASANNSLGGDMNFGYSVPDTNSFRGNTEVSMFPGQSNIPYPEVSMGKHYLETGGSNTVTANRLLETIFLSEDDCEPEDQKNFMPVRDNAIKEYGAEAKISGLSRLQMHGNFPPSGASISTPTDEFRRHHVPTRGKVDGDFLTLATGGQRRPNNHFCPKEIGSKLEDAASKQWNTCAVQKANNPWSLAGTSDTTRIQTSISGSANLTNSNIIPGQESASAQLNSSRVRQNANNPLSLAGASSNPARVQTSVGTLPSPANNLSGRTSSDRDKIIADNTLPNPFSLHTMQTPQANDQSKFLAPSDNFRFNHIPSSMPLGNTSSYPEHLNSSGLARQQIRPSQCTSNESRLALQQVRPSEFTTSQSLLALQQGSRPLNVGTSQLNFSQQQNLYSQQFNRSVEFVREALLPLERLWPSNVATSQTHFNQLQNLYGQYGRGSVNVSTNSLYGRDGEISVVHPGPRNPTPLLEATGHESIPRSIQPVGQLYPRHNAGSADARASLPIGFQPAVAVPFPNRLGVQPAAAVPFPNRFGVQPNDFTTAQSIRGPAPFPTSSQVNSSGLFPAAVNTGQRQPGIAAPFSTAPRVDYSSGQVNRLEKLNSGQASPKLHHQPLKRTATENPPYATSSQRRRTTHEPLTQNNQVPGPATARIPATAPLHITGQGQNNQVSARATAIIPATAPPHITEKGQNNQVSAPATARIPATAPPHITEKGYNELPRPTGWKCLLCKRDLSFTAEGPVYQPTNPPVVAVFPCGHTFHDECLQKITPPDQSKDPPCIPCAIGET